MNPLAPRRVSDSAAFGRVGLLVGGDSAEREVSLDGGEAVSRALSRSGIRHEVYDGPDMLFGAINAVTCEVFALAGRLDVDGGLLFETIAGSSAATVSNLFRDVGAKIVAEEFEPIFSVDNLYKDLSLGVEMARDLICQGAGQPPRTCAGSHPPRSRPERRPECGTSTRSSSSTTRSTSSRPWSG